MHKIRAFPDFRVGRELPSNEGPPGAEVSACPSSTVIDELLRKKASIREDAERSLGESEIETGKLSLVACTTRDTVIITDADHRIEWVNDSFTRNYGYSLEECRGQYGKSLIGDGEIVWEGSNPSDPSSEFAISPAECNGSVRRRSEVIRCGKDGSKRCLALECRPIVDDEGAVTGFIVIEKDITERKQAEAALLEEKQAAEAAMHAKAEFLATICHEIRNPVNVMIGMMDLALQTNLTAEQRDYLNLMKTSSGVLSRVVNDLLDLAKIESGQLETEKVPFSLRESMGNTLKMFAFDAQRKGIVLAYDIAPEVPDLLLGDPMRLGQIVINLIGNAIKFTEQGDVVLRIEREGSVVNGAEIGGERIGDSEVMCRFSIRDSGVGIPKDKQESIFKPFRQAEVSTARLYGGSGLGLSIVTHLVALMKGALWLDSEPGQGSTFFFTARFGRAAESLQKSTEVDFKGFSALLVVSHPVNRRFLANTLRQWNVVVREVDSAGAAWSCLKQANAAQNPYRLVLLDDALPDIDSDTIAAHICKNHDLSCENVVILGSSLRRKDGLSFSDSGAFTRLTMPLKPSELLATITAKSCVLMNPVPRSGTTPRREREDTAPLNLEVLLVDDSPISRRLSQLLLEQMGCRVVLAEDGLTALALLEDEPLDLVLMDMHMPNMNGLQATAAIRLKEKQTGAHLPVVALTAHIGERDWESCRQAGMDACLTKPIQTARLLEIVQKVSARQSEQSPADPPRHEVLDRQALLVRVNADQDLLAEIGGLFLGSCSKLMTRARAAMAARDQEELAHVLHTLLGMFRSLSANAAQEITERLRALSVEHEPERVALTYRQLESAVRALKAELARLIQSMRTPEPVDGLGDRRLIAPMNGRKFSASVARLPMTLRSLSAGGQWPVSALKSKARAITVGLHDKKKSVAWRVRRVSIDRPRPSMIRAMHGFTKNSSSKQP